MKIRIPYLAIAFLIASPAASIAQSPSYTIVYTAQQRGGNDELAVMEPGQKPKLITNHPAKDSSPELSADGRWLVFTSERKGWWKIWLMDLRTGDFKQLTDHSSAEYAPSWSPDGNQVLFTSGRARKPDLFIINRDGSGLRNLTSSAYSEESGYWANDGYIYYSARKEDYYQLMRIRPDGRDWELLSDGESDDLSPSLSPDGKRLVFYSYRFGNPEICLMELSSKQVTRLTDNPLQDIRPNWSPDGLKIVFERGDKRSDQQIYWMNADGSSQEALTMTGYNYAPAFVQNTDLLGNH